MVINNYDITLDFWNEYSEIKHLTPFKELYKNDKHKGKKWSSQLLWAIAAYVDMSKANPLYNLTDTDKVLLIEEDFITGKFYLEKYKELIDKMRMLLYPKELKSLYELLDKLDERTELIRITKYTLENSAALDKLIGNTSILIAAIEKMKEQLESDSDAGIVKGGREETLSEKREI